MEYTKFLVTGGNGFVGSHVVSQLLEQDAQVKILDLNQNSNSYNNNVELVIGDICNKELVAETVKGCDVVIHLAANPNLWARDKQIFNRVNLQGTINLIEQAIANKVKKFVFVSTEATILFGANDKIITESSKIHPERIYGAYPKSKYLAEFEVFRRATQGLDAIVVNPTVPIGTGDNNFGPFSRMIMDFKKGKIKAYIDGYIELIDVQDVARGIINSCYYGVSGNRYILSSEKWPIEKLFEFLATKMDMQAPKIRVPAWMGIMGAYFEEFFCSYLSKKTPLATVTGVKMSMIDKKIDSSSSIHDLKLSLHSCEHALNIMVNYLIKQSNCTGIR